jgi:multidrug efflux system membrane fusion protein
MAGQAGTETLNAPPPAVESAYAPAGAKVVVGPGAVAAAPASAPGHPGGEQRAVPLPPLTPGASHPLRTLVISLVVLVAVALIVLVGWRAHAKGLQAQATLRAQTANRPIPVVTAVAHRGDMPIYIEGLGAVTPFNVVTIHTRVDGQIMKLNFKEGQIVKEGDPLVQIDPRPYQVQLAQAQAQLAKDQAALANAKSNVSMDQSARNAISAQQLANDVATQDQDVAATQIDQAQIDSAKLELTYSNITSPITGRVGLQLVNLGNIVQTSDSTGICVITQLQPIAVEFSVNEDDIPRIMNGSATAPPLEVDAYDRDNTRRLAVGKLLAIDSEIDPTTGTVKLKATFDNKDNALFPNQFVNAHLLVKTERNAVLVPTQAVQQGPDSTFVYVVKGDAGGGSAGAPADVARTARPEAQDQPAQAEQSGGDRSAAAEHASGPAAAGAGGKAGGWGHGGAEATVSVQAVTLGASDGTQTVIATGLQSGTVVVTDGVDKLQEGSKVTPRTGAPDKPAGDSAAAAGGAATQPTTQATGHRHRHSQPSDQDDSTPTP